MAMKKWLQTIRAGADIAASDFNAVFQAMHNGLIALGFTQTADAGQWASFNVGSVPGIGQSYYGYRVYAAPADAFTATKPLILQVQFHAVHGRVPGFVINAGTSPVTAGVPAEMVQVAIGNIYPGSDAANTSTFLNSTGTCYMSWNRGLLTIAWLVGAFKSSSTFLYSRPSSPYDALEHGFVALGRGVGASGEVVGDRVVAFQNKHLFSLYPAMGGNLGWYSPSPGPRCSALRFGKPVRATNNFTPMGVWSEHRALAAGVAPIGRCYVEWDDIGMVPETRLALTGCGAMGADDTTTLNLYGTSKTFYHPSPAVSGFTPLSGDATLPATRYLSPLFEHDGVLL